MLIEAAMAVGAGIIAGSLALTSFGFDSVIELCLLYLWVPKTVPHHVTWGVLVVEAAEPV